MQDPIRAPGRVSFMDGPTLTTKILGNSTSSSGARTWKHSDKSTLSRAPQPDGYHGQPEWRFRIQRHRQPEHDGPVDRPTPLWATSIPTRSSEPGLHTLCSHLARSVRAGQLEGHYQLTVEYGARWSIWRSGTAVGQPIRVSAAVYDPKTAAIVIRRADSSSAGTSMTATCCPARACRKRKAGAFQRCTPASSTSSITGLPDGLGAEHWNAECSRRRRAYASLPRCLSAQAQALRPAGRDRACRTGRMQRWNAPAFRFRHARAGSTMPSYWFR